MKTITLKVLLALLLAAPSGALATPSTVIWTPATTYIQPFAVPHITYDSYFDGNTGYPVDTGLTLGILPMDKIQAEVGFDVLAPAPGNQFYLNGKVGTPENALFDGMPGITVGIMNFGLESEDKAKGIAGNQLNIIHAEVGKTLPYVGTIAVGGFTGNSDLLIDENGDAANTGFMVSLYRPLSEITDVLGIGVDYMSGDSSFGALGAGVTIFPTPAAGIILGVVKFNSAMGTGSSDDDMLYTAQADIDMDFKAWFAPKEAADSDAALAEEAPAAAPAEAVPATPVTAQGAPSSPAP